PPGQTPPAGGARPAPPRTPPHQDCRAPPGGTPRPSRSLLRAHRLLFITAGRNNTQEAPRRADRQSSQDDTLVGVRPPGPSPGDAVSIKSSQDKRPKRSPGETRDQEGTAISARSRCARQGAGEDERA